MLKHKIFYKQYTLIVIACLITMCICSVPVFAEQELRVGFIPGSGDDAGDEADAFAAAEIEYEEIGTGDYTLSNLSQFDVIGIDVVAYDGNPDLKSNYKVVNDYVKNGGYLVTLDYQQDSSWNENYLPYPLSLFDDDITNSREVTLAEHPLFEFPNEITAEKHFATDLWGLNLYFADGAHEVDSPWEVLVTDVTEGWPLVVGAPYGRGYVVFSALRTLQSLTNDTESQEIIEFLQNLLFWRQNLGNPSIAASPSPANGEKDVFNTPILSWVPGIDIQKHNVFFGTEVNDVNDATIDEPLSTTVSPGQALDVNYYEPGTLEYGKTYYWRVDEVNIPSRPGINKGKIWSFTVEKAALDLPFASIEKVTAISSATGYDPCDTVNGAGIDPNFPDQHSNGTGDAWASSGTDEPNNVWIQYDF
ncbi:MAG: hypothetical protein JXA96_15125, partial [Sedimentisphaerales bacterium]|nr:hypothetical protein [Sedimentisphaerales bacterium]